MTIGDRIRWMRTQKGEQQTDLSLKTGLSQAAISNFENNLLTPGNKEGKQSLRQPRGVTLTKVAMELGTTPEWLMTGVGDPKYKLQTKSTEEEKILAMLGKATPEQRKAIVAMIEMVLK
jgi:transcriptional regulator with XRE-family HTH domain